MESRYLKSVEWELQLDTLCEAEDSGGSAQSVASKRNCGTAGMSRGTRQCAISEVALPRSYIVLIEILYRIQTYYIYIILYIFCPASTPHHKSEQATTQTIHRNRLDTKQAETRCTM